MNKKKQDKIERQRKYFAYFILFMFLGSSIAAALLYNVRAPSLPKNAILDEPMGSTQIDFLVANQGAYIVAKAPISVQSELISLIPRYVPLVYLYIEEKEDTLIQVTTASGTKTFTSFDAEPFQDYLCEHLNPALTECQTRKALKAIDES